MIIKFFIYNFNRFNLQQILDMKILIAVCLPFIGLYLVKKFSKEKFHVFRIDNIKNYYSILF